MLDLCFEIINLNKFLYSGAAMSSKKKNESMLEMVQQMSTSFLLGNVIGF